MGPALAFEAYALLVEEVGLEDEVAAVLAVWMAGMEPAAA